MAGPRVRTRRVSVFPLPRCRMGRHPNGGICKRAQVANRWTMRCTIPPVTPSSSLAVARRTDPTPHYFQSASDYNCLHQDLYGEEVFPCSSRFCCPRPAFQCGSGRAARADRARRAPGTRAARAAGRARRSRVRPGRGPHAPSRPCRTGLRRAPPAPGPRCSRARLAPEQRPLAGRPPAVAGARPVAADDPVAGDGHRERIRRARTRHGSGGGRRTDPGGDLRIARRRARGNLSQHLPDLALEHGAAHVEGGVE